MVRCSVLGCKSDGETKFDDLSFHLFPENPELRSLWITVTGRKNWLPKKFSKMCCKHFDPVLLWKIGKKTYLHPNAAPNKVEVNSLASTSTTPMKTQQSETTTFEHASEVDNIISIKQETTSPIPMNDLETEFVGIRRCATPDSEVTVTVVESVKTVPRKSVLAKKLVRKTKLIAAYRKKIAALRIRNFRLQKKNKDLEELIQLYILNQ